MRGCELAVSLDVEFPMQRGAEASLSIPIPNDPVLVGGEFFLQAYGPASGANPLGVGATDALAASIGGL